MFINESYQEGPHFVIYDASREVPAKQKRPRFWRLSAVFLSLALLFLLPLAIPIIWAEGRYQFYRLSSRKTVQIEPAENQKNSFGELLWLDQKNLPTPANWQFSLLIPKIGLNAKVIENVSAQDEKAYKEALKEGVAHAAGSSLPGKEGLIYIFGHSTDYLWRVSTYNALFYLLGKLVPGDEVTLFYQGKHFIYEVAEKKVVNPDNLSFLEGNGEKLILQTCWPPGTTLKRLIIVAYPKKEVLSGFSKILAGN